MEKEAQAEEYQAVRSSGYIALTHAIKAAELYMKAAEGATHRVTATRLRRKCQELIALAEKLKTRLPSSRAPNESPTKLSNSPSSSSTWLLDRGSYLYGSRFPPWTDDSSVQVPKELTYGDAKYSDSSSFTLSAAQSENFLAWLEPTRLFSLSKDQDITALEDVMMEASNTSDLVQDITTDCSVVASLSAALKILVGKHAALSSIFHPFDHEKGRPKLSQSGQYVMKLNFNGCARQVVIDDRLPASRTDRALFVIDRHNPYLLWPALLEKAYLKVRGGYDFPGSNSGTDLWVLIGWIPEQLFLQREDVDINRIWTRLESAYEQHDVIITLGTGRISADEEQAMGLVGEHDYAVENIHVSSGTRRLLIKNPWCDGPAMKALGWVSPEASHQTEASSSKQPIGKWSHRNRQSNRSWVAIEDVAQYFESMYLNWNPRLFSHREDRHFSWQIPSKVYSTSLSKNPQYSVSSSRNGMIWILASRHFADAELDIARGKKDSMAAVARQLGYMSILIFDNEGRRAQISGGEAYRGPYVDSPQTLARFEAKADKVFTIVIDQQELPLPQYAFTMSVFSNCSVQVTETPETMSQMSEHHGTWTRRSAGGNPSSATYHQNPQYSLSIGQATPISILLSTDVDDIHVHVDIVWAHGRRVTSVRQRDLVASSGEYRRGCAIADTGILEPGTYTLVCSTFDAGQLARFILQIGSMTPVTVTSVASDTAGKHLSTLPPLRFLGDDDKYRLSVNASRLTSASVSMSSTADTRNGRRNHLPASSMVRISIIYGGGLEQDEVAVSGENQFTDPSTCVRTPQFNIEPERARSKGLWVVVESIGSHHASFAIEGEILSDSPVQVGMWQPT